MGKKEIQTKYIFTQDTTQGWQQSNPVLPKGLAGYDTDIKRMKIGDGTSTWEDLAWEGAKLYQAEKSDLNEADSTIIQNYFTQNEDSIPCADDVFVVSTKVEEVDYGKSAYIYNGSEWVAIDGNVDAGKVIFREDILCAGNYTAVGNITKASAAATSTFQTKGKSAQEIFAEIFSKRLQPSVTAQPSVSGFSLSGAAAVEAGTKVPTATFGTAKLNPGTYTYGPDTGVTATSYSVSRVATPETMNKENVAEAASGTDDNDGNGFIIGDQTGDNVVSSLKYTVTVNYGDGAVANDNMGSPSSPPIKISAGSKSQTTAAYTPYRKYFYGATSDDVVGKVDSAVIRKLTGSTAAYKAGTITVEVPAGSKSVIIACPATNKGLTKVINESAMNADVTETFTQDQTDVQGANGYTAISYKYWIFTPAIPFENKATLKVTLG